MNATLLAPTTTLEVMPLTVTSAAEMVAEALAAVPTAPSVKITNKSFEVIIVIGVLRDLQRWP